MTTSYCIAYMTELHRHREGSLTLTGRQCFLLTIDGTLYPHYSSVQALRVRLTVNSASRQQMSTFMVQMSTFRTSAR